MAESEEKPAVKELTSAQRKAIAVLLVSKDIGRAAAELGVSERTLYRWGGDPVFHAALVAAEGEAIDYAVRRLVKLGDKAIDTLEKVLDDDQASASTRVRAALGVLATLGELRTLRNLEVRLTALEAMYADTTRQP